MGVVVTCLAAAAPCPLGAAALFFLPNMLLLLLLLFNKPGGPKYTYKHKHIERKAVV